MARRLCVLLGLLALTIVVVLGLQSRRYEASGGYHVDCGSVASPKTTHYSDDVLPSDVTACADYRSSRRLAVGGLAVGCVVLIVGGLILFRQPKKPSPTT